MFQIDGPATKAVLFDINRHPLITVH